jgi:hypothetical protein
LGDDRIDLSERSADAALGGNGAAPVGHHHALDRDSSSLAYRSRPTSASWEPRRRRLVSLVVDVVFSHHACWRTERGTDDMNSKKPVQVRVPDAVQRALALLRRAGTHAAILLHRPRINSASLRAAQHPGHELCYATDCIVTAQRTK